MQKPYTNYSRSNISKKGIKMTYQQTEPIYDIANRHTSVRESKWYRYKQHCGIADRHTMYLDKGTIMLQTVFTITYMYVRELLQTETIYDMTDRHTWAENQNSTSRQRTNVPPYLQLAFIVLTMQECCGRLVSSLSVGVRGTNPEYPGHCRTLVHKLI